MGRGQERLRVDRVSSWAGFDLAPAVAYRPASRILLFLWLALVCCLLRDSLSQCFCVSLITAMALGVCHYTHEYW